MVFRKILVPIGGGAATPRIVHAALLFARATGAHISALHVQADAKEAVPLLGEGMSGSMIEDMVDMAEKEGDERSKRAREKFDAFVQANGLTVQEDGAGGDGGTASLTFTAGREDEMVARLGKVSDLVVSSRPNPGSDRPPLMMVHAAIFETGKPVLLLPLEPIETLGSNILIAWSGASEGARAVSAAMPLLEKADKVTVTTVESEKSLARVGADELVQHLAWHGVTAAYEGITSDGRPAGELISAKAKDLGCDLMVMGAFTHSRLIQIILGGVTRHMMNASEIPILMSH